MRIWHLEKEYDAFIAAVTSAKGKAEGRGRGERGRRIRAEVLEKGERALMDCGRRFDGWTEDYPLKASVAELESAASAVTGADAGVLKGMIEQVTPLSSLSEGQRPRTYRRRGLKVVEQPVPVERALVYVPGGTAPYPSSLVMGAVPAQIAGVKEIYATTPTRDGKHQPLHRRGSAAPRDHGRLQDRRGTGDLCLRVWCRRHTEGRHDRGSGQCLRGGGEEGRLRPGGHRHARGPERARRPRDGALPARTYSHGTFSPRRSMTRWRRWASFLPPRRRCTACCKSMERLISSNKRREIVERALNTTVFWSTTRRSRCPVRDRRHRPRAPGGHRR